MEDLKKETRRISKVVLNMTCSSQNLQLFKGASKFECEHNRWTDFYFDYQFSHSSADAAV